MNRGREVDRSSILVRSFLFVKFMRDVQGITYRAAEGVLRVLARCSASRRRTIPRFGGERSRRRIDGLIVPGADEHVLAANTTGLSISPGEERIAHSTRAALLRQVARGGGREDGSVRGRRRYRRQKGRRRLVAGADRTSFGAVKRPHRRGAGRRRLRHAGQLRHAEATRHNADDTHA